MAERLRTLAEAPEAERIALLVRESKFGMGMAELVARTGLQEREIAAAAAQAPLVVLQQPQSWFVDRAWFQSARDGLLRAVREFHQNESAAARHPQAGSARPRAAGCAAVPDGRPARAGEQIVVEGETVRLAAHRLVLKQDEEQARAAIERAFEQAGLAVPAVAEVLAKSGVEAARARSLAADSAAREARLVRVSDDLVFHHTAMEKLRPCWPRTRRALQRRHVQGMDRHLAQIRDPAARVPGPRARHAAGGR